jgi:hypothetical protein
LHAEKDRECRACSGWYQTQKAQEFDRLVEFAYNRQQPSLHKFIADTIFDFGQDDLDGYDLITLFMLLKTVADVLHDATSKLGIADSPWLRPTAVFANPP